MIISEEFYLKEVNDLAKANESSNYFMVMTFLSTFFFLELNLLCATNEIDYITINVLELSQISENITISNINRFEINPPSNIANKWIENYDNQGDLRLNNTFSKNILTAKVNLNSKSLRNSQFTDSKILKQLLTPIQINKYNADDFLSFIISINSIKYAINFFSNIFITLNNILLISRDSTLFFIILFFAIFPTTVSVLTTATNTTYDFLYKKADFWSAFFVSIFGHINDLNNNTLNQEV